MKTGTDLRREVIKEVEDCVCRDRQNTYGDAEENFADIAAIANILFRRKLKDPLDARDVAAFSAAIKVARIATSPDHLDNWVDLAGYAVCGAGIVKRGAEDKEWEEKLNQKVDEFERRNGLQRAEPSVPRFHGSSPDLLKDDVIRHLGAPIGEAVRGSNGNEEFATRLMSPYTFWDEGTSRIIDK